MPASAFSCIGTSLDSLERTLTLAYLHVSVMPFTCPSLDSSRTSVLPTSTRRASTCSVQGHQSPFIITSRQRVGGDGTT